MRASVISVFASALVVTGGVVIGAPAPKPARTQPPPVQPVAVPAVPAVPTLYPLPAAPVQPEPCPLPPTTDHEEPATGTPKVPDSQLPAPAGRIAHQVNLAPLAGKGMWWTLWPDSHIDAAGMVAKATGAGLHQIWIRTGSTDQGFYGARLLTALLPAAHAAGLAVVAWDFPKLSDPVADAVRAAATLDGTFGGEHIDAFSPDLETKYEGTYDTVPRVTLYLSLVDGWARDIPLVATVMNPTDRQLASYPYAAQAPYVDAFAPMVYWSCTEPGAAATAALSALSKLRPVHLIGQAYDMTEDGGRPGLPTGSEEWRFLDVADSAGAIGASFYVAETATAPEWAAIGAYPWH
jgi:hypothetical protein